MLYKYNKMETPKQLKTIFLPINEKSDVEIEIDYWIYNFNQNKNFKNYMKKLYKKGIIKENQLKFLPIDIYNKITKNKIILHYCKLRFEVFKRDNFTCQYCGRNVKENGIKLCVDHVIPVSKGGQTISDNLTTACYDCNLGKKDILLELKLLNKIKNEN
jgi:hypothetical protein